MARADIVDLGRRAKVAARALAVAGGGAKDSALRVAADLLEQRHVELLEHNAGRPRAGPGSRARPTSSSTACA